MNRLVLSLALIATCAVANVSNAAIVIFEGRVVSQGGPNGFLGAPPAFPVNFSVNLTVADGAGPLGVITAGTFEWIGNSTQFITGGSATLNDAGAADTISFIVTTSAGTGLFNFGPGAFIGGNAINQGTMDGFVQSTPGVHNSTGFNFITAGGTVYQGTITAVPEPSAALALFGLVGLGACRMRARRKTAA